MKKIIICILLSLISLSCIAQLTKQRESYYRDLFADSIGAETEYVLPDLSRVDIINDTFAIEVEFADKWAESIGQSLYYATILDKKPGVLLIVESTKDVKEIRRLMTIAALNNIKVWIWDYTTNICKKVDVGFYYSY
jgi:hypothetical protein